MYDFAIIGSGYGGFIPALRLIEKGFSVVALEKGKEFADTDFKQSYSPTYFRKLYDCYYTDDFQTFFTTAAIIAAQ
jgi:choline dehydrogenase-like flavoprotein